MAEKKCEHGHRRRECKDCGGTSICEHGRRRHRCKNCGVGVTRVYKTGAKRRGYSWELTDDQAWWIMRQACVFCGSTTEVNGIDRDKNGYGYTTLNSMPCCSTCNYMKQSSTTEEFLNQVQRIAAHTATYEQFKQRRDLIRQSTNSIAANAELSTRSDSRTPNSPKVFHSATVANNSLNSSHGQRGSKLESMEREEINDRIEASATVTLSLTPESEVALDE